MHTDHSGDCATPVEVLLRTAKAHGLGAIAVTDHNEISGALEAQRLARGSRGQGIAREGGWEGTQGQGRGPLLSPKLPGGRGRAATGAQQPRRAALGGGARPSEPT